MRKLLHLSARVLCIIAFLLVGTLSFGQGKSPEKKPVPAALMEHIKKNKQKHGLSDADIADLVLVSESNSRAIRHYYLKQQIQGIEIHGAVTNISVGADGKVIAMGNRFQKQVAQKVKSNKASLTAADAVAAAAGHLNLSLKEALTVKERGEAKSGELIFSTGGISLEPIPARLVYQPMEDGNLVLAWEVSIYELDAQHWWSLRVDANTGKVLDKDNMVVQCQFENDGPAGKALHANHGHSLRLSGAEELPYAYAAADKGNVYNVYRAPIESPIHGPRSLVPGTAADKVASPQGWHHTPTGQLTTTRGNNVFAYEDPNNNNSLNNYSPDGGASLTFDYPIDLTKQPVEYRDAAITNLFYWNNKIHDVWYQYGFDEASGNFQADNFGKGGTQNDPVLAEAQDNRNGTSRNNANFATPSDGNRPRMQMYLWSGKPDPDMFRVTTPGVIAGSYPAAQASFGPKLTSTPITGKLVLVRAMSGNPQEGCSAAVNSADIAGNIAVVYRGSCPFVDKVLNAQAAGARAVVVINNVSGAPIAMGTGTGAEAIVIPSVMVSDVTGALIREQLDGNQEVQVALKNDGGPELDGDLDNGIIVHEYGHGISNRLTGGRTVVNCLNNAEQMGEGWSDWFGLVMTMRPSDTPDQVRGIGTYALGQPTTGRGIRPAPYSRDFGVNNYTYGATNATTLSQPHGIGFVWATMLWDMTWDLVDKYGFDPDMYHGKGGNNMAMQLVIDGLKLQVCRPGFVDGRDAILLADRIDYGGANQELIWKAFARRGLGFSASQGANTNRSDQVEAFDLPASYPCTTPLTITAVPSSDTYTGGVPTNLYIGYGPQAVKLVANGDSDNVYEWIAGTGLSSTNVHDPVFAPTAAGVYTFTVKAVNADNCTKYQSITITVVDVRCDEQKENTGNDKEKMSKILVCVDGQTDCVAKVAVSKILAHGGKLGTCTSTAASQPASMEHNSFATDNETSVRNYPNPFTGSTTFDFTVKESGYTTLKVYDMMGRVVDTLFEGHALAGEMYSKEYKGEGLNKGVYFYRLISGSTTKVGAMLMER